MPAVRNVQGLRRWLFLLRLEVTIFFHFLPMLLSGSLPPRRFYFFLKRLLLFVSTISHNKFVKIGRSTRMDLYVPSFPTPAFYVACRKFMAFDEQLPCTTVLLSVTSACRFSCPHCYQRHDLGKNVSIETLLPVVRKLQDRGIAFFNIEGGEPFLAYDRLKSICASLDGRSEVWVNSTGDGITLERLKELKTLNLTAVMFSLHTAEPATLNAFMGSDKAWENLTQGIALCQKAGIAVAFNSCVQRDVFFNGDFERIMEQAKQFGGCLIQLIKPKPAGASLQSGTPGFSQQDLQHVKNVVQRYNHEPAYADYPSISAQIMEEDPACFGCTAGGTDRFYINAKGDVQPCEFLHLSFGNIAEEDFDVIYNRMRKTFSTPRETWLCEGCAPQVRHLLQSQSPMRLPLNKELSAQIYKDWDRGNPTKLYSEIERLK